MRLNEQTTPLVPADSHARIPALDGVRGLAVVLVLICHATVLSDVPTAAGKLYLALARLSWAGVDLFFVLSGFLITGILFDAKGKTNYFRNFYARRTVRIFPLYYVFIALTLFIIPRFAPAIESHFVERPPVSWPYWSYVSNFYQTFQPTHHIVFVSWSLAIEEQFYMVWPLVVFFFGRKALLRITIGMIVGSILLRIGIMGPLAGWLQESLNVAPWRVANNFSFCRLDGLAIGAWIALLIRGNTWTAQSLVRPAKIVGTLAALALAATVGAMYVSGWRGGIGQSPAYVLVGYTMLAIMFGSLLAVAIGSRSDSLVARAFQSRTLTVFGKYSYAAYLIHFPLNILIRDLLFDPQTGSTVMSRVGMQFAFYIASGCTTLMFAWVSWHVMEKHFLKLKDFFQSAPPAPPRPDENPMRMRQPSNEPMRLSA